MQTQSWKGSESQFKAYFSSYMSNALSWHKKKLILVKVQFRGQNWINQYSSDNKKNNNQVMTYASIKSGCLPDIRTCICYRCWDSLSVQSAEQSTMSKLGKQSLVAVIGLTRPSPCPCHSSEFPVKSHHEHIFLRPAYLLRTTHGCWCWDYKQRLPLVLGSSNGALQELVCPRIRVNSEYRRIFHKADNATWLYVSHGTSRSQFNSLTPGSSPEQFTKVSPMWVATDCRGV